MVPSNSPYPVWRCESKLATTRNENKPGKNRLTLVERQNSGGRARQSRERQRPAQGT